MRRKRSAVRDNDVSADAGMCTTIEGKRPVQDALMGRNVCDSLGRILSEGLSQKFLRGNLNVPRGRIVAEARNPSYLGLIHAYAECQNMLSRLLVPRGACLEYGIDFEFNTAQLPQQQMPPR